MTRSTSQLFVCPITHTPLETIPDAKDARRRAFRNRDGRVFPVQQGIPDFTYSQGTASTETKVRDFYDNRAEAYDQFLYLTFKTHNENEMAVRNGFIDLMRLRKDSRVLEVACGTGRDSVLIARRLGRHGTLALQDISPLMLRRCVRKMKRFNTRQHFCLSNAAYLPFPDRCFDAVYSFGGLGEFPDIKRCLAEMVRVCKVGGRVVAGDESMPPWLRQTEFAKILTHTNPQFAAGLPLDHIPVQARNFTLRWVIGGVFYLMDFDVGEGEPKGNFDIPIPGIRGGTLRDRYHGMLECVTPATKQLAQKARERAGVSMHDWLEKVILKAARKQLGRNRR